MNESSIFKGKILTISNFISLFRLFLCYPTVYFLWEENMPAALMLGITAFISDYLDGYFARKLNQVSELGKILDPLADKVFIAAIAITFLLQGKLPLWFAMIVVGRDFLILCGSAFAAGRIKFVLPSNKAGKLTVNFLSLTFLSVLFNIRVLTDLFFCLSTIMVFISLVLYGIKMFAAIRYKELS